MPTIFDPDNRWLSVSPLELSLSNKLPVAMDDTLSVLIDSGPVSVDVLANDFDPEGQALTLLSASAALGTAVAEIDNTVTYTPPTGISGFDTVVYSIADDLGQTRDGQINVTITDPQLSIDVETDNTLTVNAETGQIEITIDSPAVFAGLYLADTADLNSGPVNLVPPAVSGTASVGEILTATPGLWVYDAGTGNSVTRSWQWRRGGTQDIAGATAGTYTFATDDTGPGVAALEILTDSLGQRSSASQIFGASSFAPDSDPLLLGWWDASDTGTITESGSLVSSWADKAGGAPLVASGIHQPVTGSRILNVANVIDFSSSQYFERPGFAVPASGDLAIHMVLVIDATSNAFEAILAFDATNDFQIDANNAGQFDGRLNVANIGTSTDLSGGPFSGAIILSAVFDRSASAQAEIFIANVSRGSLAYTASIDTNVALHLMTNRSKNAWVDGAVAELILTEDTSNRSDFHTYLATKWGL